MPTEIGSGLQEVREELSEGALIPITTGHPSARYWSGPALLAHAALGERVVILAIAGRVRRHTHVVNGVGVEQLIGVHIRRTYAVRAQLILAIGR